MGFNESILLFGIMVVLAAMPSTSVALVVTRSATLGVAHGIAVAAGTVLGDLVFIMLAIFGLTVVAETMGSLFMIIKYLGALYLLWFGYSLLRANSTTKKATNGTSGKRGILASFLAGFLLTLGDVKAIVFYASLFPVFVNLSALSIAEVLTIALITLLSVGGVKVLYALSATKIASVARERKFEKAAQKTAGGLMIGAGAYLIVKA